jgi:hypothetical protein
MGTKMFKVGSFEEELAKSMERGLVSNRLENKYSFDKIAKVADYLSAAAELLDDTGYSVESEMVTKVLSRLAGVEEDENDAKHQSFQPKHKSPVSYSDFENDYGHGTPESLDAAEEADKVMLDMNPEEIIIEPLDLELEVPPREKKDSDEYLEFQSIATKLAAKLHKKKV